MYEHSNLKSYIFIESMDPGFSGENERTCVMGGRTRPGQRFCNGKTMWRSKFEIVLKKESTLNQ
jgi:hypothetical protein